MEKSNAAFLFKKFILKKETEKDDAEGRGLCCFFSYIKKESSCLWGRPSSSAYIIFRFLANRGEKRENMVLDSDRKKREREKVVAWKLDVVFCLFEGKTTFPFPAFNVEHLQVACKSASTIYKLKTKD